ncbi:MAG: hypothetical protein PF445_07405 [Melioribacteraceae bacterium]|jgi:hypothetical protein|nr:hypothetical protein [Melioribacteraceae bacterium]
MKNIKLSLTNNSFTNIFIAVKNILIKISLLLSITFLFLGVHYSNFTVTSNNDNVVLTWQTTVEGNLKETSVERRVVNGVFSSIGSVPAKGDNSSYTFIDENAFKVQASFYTYRLVFIKNDGTKSSDGIELGVSHTTSVEKRTWGSIKALFR